MEAVRSDALVFFGATGDLAHKKIFPALQAMLKRGNLNVPVIGVAKAGWKLDDLKNRAKDSLQQHGGLDPAAFDKLCGLLRYVDGDYNNPATFAALHKELGGAQRPAHYLAIPPVLFGTVVQNLAKSGCTSGARVIVEKPFGRDLKSAKELNRILHATFPEESIFRIDHYLGKTPVHNMMFFRFTNMYLQPFFDREHVESVQLTMAENFGVQGRGGFYDATGAVRDVMQNHLFQIIANLAMEAPARLDAESVRDEKVKVLKAIPAIGPADLVRGQFSGYLKEAGVAPGSTTETFGAMRLRIDSWRWQGVPFYLRAGKNLPVTCTEFVIRLRKPPTIFPDIPIYGNTLRFRISPDVGVGYGTNILEPGSEKQSQLAEIMASKHPDAKEMDAYERLLGDAMRGDATLFAREDYVEEAWRIVDPVLASPPTVQVYEPGTWGPAEAMKQFGPPGGWHASVVESK
ncbi:MAG: glucose-6-phosphate dehydrogenase [Phycisphaerales bacterium]|nr:glucose-6-phosphate dehydrogenase [Planctomycetota bacterium]